MNLYSANILKKDIFFDVVTYNPNHRLHEESMKMAYFDNSSQKNGTLYLAKKMPLHNCIMNILDYDIPDKTSSLTTFASLENTLPLLGIKYPFDEKYFIQFISAHSQSDILSSAEQIMPVLQICFEAYPALSYLYPLYYKVMQLAFRFAAEHASAELIQTASVLSEEIDNLKELYEQAKTYLSDVLIKPSEQGIEWSSSTNAELYHAYCLNTQNRDFLCEIFSSMNMKTAFSATDTSTAQDWLAYLDIFSTQITSDDITEYPITSFKQFLYIGIRQLLKDELVIKKCKLCGGYFRVKYSSNQEYCTRIYRNTSTTCNEYASRKSYKERLFSHPIHTEFTKAYNRLYARIRRGKLPADTPLMDQLKALHDEYTEKYENTHQKDRETVWKEYIERNKKLLK